MLDILACITNLRRGNMRGRRTPQCKFDVIIPGALMNLNLLRSSSLSSHTNLSGFNEVSPLVQLRSVKNDIYREFYLFKYDILLIKMFITIYALYFPMNTTLTL